MNLLVISDLHISNGDRFDTFGWQNEDLIAMIQKIILKKNIDKVIMNGDIFELYKYKMADIIEKNTLLFEYLTSEKFVYIKGNHDIFNDFGLNNLLIENSSGQKIYFEHGHNADMLNGTFIGRYISKLSLGLMKRLIRFDPILNIYLRKVNAMDEVDCIPKKYNSYQYLQYAMRLLKTYDLVVLGHTHKLEMHKTYFLNKKKYYLNSGSCSLGRFQALVIDTETLKCNTIKLSRKAVVKRIEKIKRKDNNNSTIKLTA